MCVAAYRLEHERYCNAREHYEETLSRLAVAGAGMDMLQDELSQSEWTNDVFKHRLGKVMEEMADQEVHPPAGTPTRSSWHPHKVSWHEFSACILSLSLTARLALVF